MDASAGGADVPLDAGNGGASDAADVGGADAAIDAAGDLDATAPTSDAHVDAAGQADSSGSLEDAGADAGDGADAPAGGAVADASGNEDAQDAAASPTADAAATFDAGGVSSDATPEPGDVQAADAVTGPIDAQDTAAGDASSTCAADADCAALAATLGPCQVAACDPSTGSCVVVDAADATPCDDGDPCTTGDACQGGVCAGTPVDPDCAPCATASDCDDGNPCTTDQCDPATHDCIYVVVPGAGCCSSDAHCDDGDACTVDACVDFQCHHEAAATPECCPSGGVVFAADFEQEVAFEVDNASALGGWQLSAARAHSGSQSLWYGSALTGNLDFPAAEGTVTSAPFFLPPSYALTLHLWRWTANKYDNIEVHLLTEGGDVVLYDAFFAAVEQDWEEITADLKPWGGQQVQVQIVAHHVQSNHEGIYVDDIKVDSDCTFPQCGDGLCNGDEHCLSCPQDCPAPQTCPAFDGCTAWQYPTCAGCACETCVCAIDPTCCTVQWDEGCAGLCGTQCGSPCAPPPGCEPTGGPGCGGCACEVCVCAVDAYCCTDAWDALCGQECAACGTPCP